MRSLRSTVAIGGLALLLVGGSGCGTIAKKALKEGVKSATHGSVDINDNGLTVHDSNGNACTAKIGDTGAKGTCVDSNGKTVAEGGVDTNGNASGKVTDSNGTTCSGSIGTDSNDTVDTGKGKCVDSNGDTTGTASADSNGVTIKDSNDSSTFQSGNGTSLPTGWPSELDPPSGTKLTSSIKTSDNAQITFADANGSVDHVFSAFDSHLKSAGWKQTSNASIDGNRTAEYSKGAKDASVIVSKATDSNGISGMVTLTNTNN